MSSLFKRFKKSLPVATSSNTSYYKRENLIQNINDLKHLLAGAPEIPEVRTDKEITLNNVSLLKFTPQLLKSKFGNPASILDLSDIIPGHKVFFYKNSVDYYKFLIQYHFIKNDFFFASNKISSMTALSDKDKERIMNRIQNKYLDNNGIKNGDLIVKVVDDNGSIIYTIDDVYFHLHYIPGNITKQNLLAKYAEIPENQAKPGGFKESLEQYI